MLGRLEGKVAFLTAAGQGIGKSTAIAFAKEGAEVIATDIDANKLQMLDKVPGITTKVLDVLDDSAIEEITKEVPIPDILFNCAGYVHQGSIIDCKYDDWDHSFRLNTRSHFVITKNFMPKLLSKKNVSIINVASVASSVKGVINRYAYGSSKAAVIGMTKALAADFVKQGVRVNAICPGTVDTPSLSERMLALGDVDKARQEFTKRQPMGRLGEPDEIATIAVYLASDESRFVTGQTMMVDGGITI